MPGVAFIIPTWNRPGELARTLGAIGGLPIPSAVGGAEVIIADNDSSPPAAAPVWLPNGVPVRIIRLGGNAGAAARNIAAAESDARWLVMLDDDSRPAGPGLFDALSEASDDTGAIGAEIHLTAGRREAGGLPEVFVGCGVAIRRRPFLDASGYDPSFQYYAEEYDCAAKLILDGWRITHDRRFRVLHEKSLTHRDMDRICRRLVRNNAWVAMRYAPTGLRWRSVTRDASRYARIAVREDAALGFGIGMIETAVSLPRQPRRTMTQAQWDRFTGLTAVRDAFESDDRLEGDPLVCVVERGKNDWVVDQVIAERGLRTIDDPRRADALIVGACSPGPMLDAVERWAARGLETIAPWRFERARRSGITERTPLTLAS